MSFAIPPYTVATFDSDLLAVRLPVKSLPIRYFLPLTAMYDELSVWRWKTGRYWK